ncbi:MAG: class I SAM-dependent methyltransferase [Acidobacteriota bacterium]
MRYEIDGYHIVECEKCGLCYVAESVSSIELTDYYDEAYYSGARNKGYSDYVGSRNARKAHFRSLLPVLRRYLPSGDVRVLDIGCAAGFFLEVAQEAGWKAQGIELSPYMSEYARHSLGLDVLTGRLEEIDFGEARFELVTMWDVIEHLADPLAAIRRAHSLLAPGGLIAISTGDIGGATARIYDRRWALLAPPGHLFYFSRRTLFAMLRQAHFEPLGWQSDGVFLMNTDGDENMSPLRSAVNALHHNRVVNAILRRLKLGSIMTVYARKCGNS